MIKKIIAILLITFVLFLFLGCKQQPDATERPTTPTTEVPVEDPVGEVGTGISDISDVDEELDSSELNDLDAILEDIENI